MKVKPHIKYKPLLPSEARVINIDEKAIAELLLEHLTENVSHYFHIPMISENAINVMYWNRKHNILTYVVMPIQYINDGYSLDFDEISKMVGITTDSLYSGSMCKYKTIELTPRVLKRKI